MTTRGIAAHSERNSQGLWISVSCGVSVDLHPKYSSAMNQSSPVQYSQRRRANSLMKRGQFSEEQISGIRQEVEAGQKVADVGRKWGISEATYYRWKSAYGGWEVSQMHRLRQLEDEKARR